MRSKDSKRAWLFAFTIAAAAFACAGKASAQVDTQGPSQATLSQVSSTVGVSPASIEVQGFASCAITLDPSTSPAWAGTVVFEGSAGGSTQQISVAPINGGTPISTLTNAGYIYVLAVAGLSKFDVRATAVSAGSMLVSWTCSRAAPAFIKPAPSLSAGSSSAPQYTRIQDGTGTVVAQVGNVFGYGDGAIVADGFSVSSADFVYNGSSWDRARTAAGITGGSAPAGLGAFAPCNGYNANAYCAVIDSNGSMQFKDVDSNGFLTSAIYRTSIASGAGTTTVYASGGRFFGISVTTAGTAAVCGYDNTAASGLALFCTPSTTVVGQIYPIGMPAGGMPMNTGLTITAPASSPAMTVLYSH